MDNSKILLNLLESILGKSKRTSKGNYSFMCPNGCHPTKHKLEIDINTNENNENPWNCWICGSTGFKGKKLNSLFKKIGASQSKINELKLLITPGAKHEYINDKISLPEEFIPLTNINNISNKHELISIKHAIKFLKSRDITKQDIIKHNLGLCVSGRYQNRIIIPSYDANKHINFFTARTWDDDITPHYINPQGSRNIIGFEYFINWNLPIILCEGGFDALSIKRNVIPLFGKTIPEVLMKKIVTSQVKKIYIALDKDAQKDSLKHAETLISYGKQVYLVDMKDKDPNKLGFKKFTEIIQNTYPITFSKLFELKLDL